MKNRRSLTPPQGVPVHKGMHAMRRGGARVEVSERVLLRGRSGEQHEGWALNVSRGGVRVILEENVVLGTEFDVTVGDPAKGGTAARGRIVWVQEEPDGVICGVEFLGDSASHSSAPPPPVAPAGARVWTKSVPPNGGERVADAKPADEGDSGAGASRPGGDDDA